MRKELQQEIENRLSLILRELREQTSVASSYPPDALSFSDEMRQIEEYIRVAGEYEIAYETIVASISAHPYTLSGAAAVALLEAGLMLGFKTGRKEDHIFDRR